MNALIGARKPSSGRVLVNNFDLYQHLDSLKQAIGHVPQDDIIHRELTVYQTLFYVARLRLSRDVNQRDIDQIDRRGTGSSPDLLSEEMFRFHNCQADKESVSPSLSS